MTLADRLRTIDRRLAELRPRLFTKLGPPAQPASLSALGDALFEGQLPPELVTFFGWHDGQEPWSGPIHPSDGALLISADRALNEWRRRSDPSADILRPWSASWLPLFENGFGDLVVYETTGPRAGTLINCLHDDAGRSQKWPSLDAWAADLDAALLKLGDDPSWCRELTVSLGGEWHRSPLPPTEELATCPVGTAYLVRAIWGDSAELSPPERGLRRHLSVKLLRNDKGWCSGYGASDDEALADLRARLLEAPASEWACEYDGWTTPSYLRREPFTHGLAEGGVFVGRAVVRWTFDEDEQE